MADTGRGTLRPMPVKPREILLQVIEKHGFTDAEIASAAEANATTVYRWREGRTNLTERKLRAALEGLGLDPTEYGLRPAPRVWSSSTQDDPPAWAVDLDRKVSALIAFHRSGGNTEHLEGV